MSRPQGSNYDSFDSRCSLPYPLHFAVVFGSGPGGLGMATAGHGRESYAVVRDHLEFDDAQVPGFASDDFALTFDVHSTGRG